VSKTFNTESQMSNSCVCCSHVDGGGVESAPNYTLMSYVYPDSSQSL